MSFTSSHTKCSDCTSPMACTDSGCCVKERDRNARSDRMMAQQPSSGPRPYQVAAALSIRRHNNITLRPLSGPLGLSCNGCDGKDDVKELMTGNMAMRYCCHCRARIVELFK